MSTKFPDLFAALAEPFRPEMIQAKPNGQRYITARAVQTRLDEVLGAENWTPAYKPWSEDAVYCALTITLPDGSALTKGDVGAYSSMAERNGQLDAGDDDKGGFSDALKRAALAFGVGRHLYDQGRTVPVYATSDAYAPPPSAAGGPAPPRRTAPPRGGAAPAPAPDPAPDPAPANPGRTNVNGKAHNGPPRSGRALFAWCKDREQEYQVGLLKYLNGWAKLQEFPGRMVDWDADQVALAVAEAERKLHAVAVTAASAYEEAAAQ